jgi:hypothetical protein
MKWYEQILNRDETILNTLNMKLKPEGPKGRHKVKREIIFTAVQPRILFFWDMMLLSLTVRQYPGLGKVTHRKKKKKRGTQALE